MSTTTSTPSKPPEPSARFHQKDRGRAWKTYRILSKVNPDRWHIGVASNRLLMLDVDSTAFYHALHIATYVRYIHPGRMAIFQTKRGYHIICDRPCISENQWANYYRAIMRFCERAQIPLDFQHAELSLKWGKTVLRITPKGGDGPPRLVKVI